MRRLVRIVMTSVGCVIALTMATAVSAGALVTPTTGQPGASAGNTCPGTAGTPGNSVSAPGSTFNPNGQSGSVYAGNTGTHSLAANSTAAVSQYDAACFRPTH
jgi:hypothetical protein